MRPLTHASLPNLFDFMCSRYGMQVVQKASAPEMKLISTFLDAIGVLDKTAFMKQYATILGRRLYLNYKVGTTKVPAITQAMMAAHEPNHVLLMEAMGSLNYNIKYMADPSERGLIEVDCYECDLTVYWWWHKATHNGMGALPDIDMAKILKAYRCTGKKAGPALKKFEKAVKVIKKGGIASPTALDVIDFYEMME